ncbi:MAG: class I SAM-dependent methyltransferase [Devosia sp.]|uniref:class I SAM-dependent methyltransferase n=1 Tax=Devosia sp. TaxID=1871048 RepID=UPI001AC4AFD4|nr:class I SAM-dependent methyltransferase [Devosia sp.]MBN9308423.1 class I SAM-dependent methyltransferase [Devosia sp.]MBN9317255.1 class I SAM-dependent methyltransferase [Devosia sp.]
MKSRAKAGTPAPIDLSAYPQAYLVPTLLKVLGDCLTNGHGAGPILDLGCGDGTLDRFLEAKGYTMIGIDADRARVREAKRRDPKGHYVVGSAYENLHTKYGTFPAVISIEVIEHLFDPHRFADTVFSLLEPGGVAIITTPYHGYVKNLALALSGRMDRHFTALWPGGHVKFWSVKTISELLSGAGLAVEQVIRIGRVPPLARSMLIVARKPSGRQPDAVRLH